MNFAEKVENYRKNLCLTQEALAARCSITRQAVAKWEKGESMISAFISQVLRKARPRCGSMRSR